MSEADKLFQKMKYVKNNSCGTLNYIKLSKNTIHYIRFYEKRKVFWAYIFIPKEGKIETKQITMQELKAINLKCKELGFYRGVIL